MQELIHAVNRLISAKSLQEAERVFTNHPELLEEKNICALTTLAAIKLEEDETEMARILEQLADKLARVGESARRANTNENESASDHPKSSLEWMKWVLLFLALRQPDALKLAIDASHSDIDIVSLIQSIQEQDTKRLDLIAPQLHRKLLAAGRRQEAITVVLVGLDLQLGRTEQLVSSPKMQAPELLLRGVQTAYEAYALAKTLGDEPCQAFYKAAEATGQYRLRRLKDAEAAYQEALNKYRELAQIQPQIYTSYLAMTLNNFGHVLRDLRLMKKAETALHEAVDLRRKLAAFQPEVHEPHLAVSLNTLGTILLELDRSNEAEAAFQQALQLRRKLAAAQPTVYEPAVAMTLNNLGIVLTELARWDEAEQALKETLTIYRHLATNSKDYTPIIVTTLNNLADVFKRSDRPNEAELVLKEVNALAMQN